MTEVVAHVSPYKRIEIGPPTPQPKKPAPAQPVVSQAILDAYEEIRRARYLRIWDHVVQTAQGCNAPTAAPPSVDTSGWDAA